MERKEMIKIVAFIAAVIVLLGAVWIIAEFSKQKSLPLEKYPTEQSPIVTYDGGEIRNANEFDGALGNLGEKIVVIKFAIYNPGPRVIGVNQFVVSKNTTETMSLSAPHIFRDGTTISNSTYWMVNSGTLLHSVINFDVQQAITVGQTINFNVTVAARGNKPGDTIQITFDRMNWFVDPWSEFALAQTGLYNTQGEILTFP